jgi:hypothetical protein
MNVDIGTPETVGAGFIGLAILYKVWRVLKSDRNQDNGNEAQSKLRDDLIQLVKDLTVRCDNFAAQRNDYMVENAELKAQIAALELELATIQRRLGLDAAPILIENDPNKM